MRPIAGLGNLGLQQFGGVGFRAHSVSVICPDIDNLAVRAGEYLLQSLIPLFGVESRSMTEDAVISALLMICAVAGAVTVAVIAEGEWPKGYGIAGVSAPEGYFRQLAWPLRARGGSGGGIR